MLSAQVQTSNLDKDSNTQTINSKESDALQDADILPQPVQEKSASSELVQDKVDKSPTIKDAESETESRQED